MDRVVLGLSGGVDSAVAAARLKAAGFEVRGLFLEVGLGGTEQAQDMADALGIPLYIAHRREAFEQQICAQFAAEYRACRTPNPCIMCNPLIKFRALTDYADEIGAAYVATGHYARTGVDAAGRALLRRGASAKDQSYMLYRLPRKTIARCIFPLGEAENKDSVRENAREIGLSNADQPDSMDVCFIPDGDTQGWLERHGCALPEGNFVDEAGHILGRHKGLHCYTVGQRKGLGVAASGRLFVHRLDPVRNEVVLSLEDAFSHSILLENVHFIAPEYAENGDFNCEVRVRFSKRADRATVSYDGRSARVTFTGDGVRAPAPGQSAVFYDGDIVIGGGFISG